MIEINGKIYRNIQEQVEKNKEDIEELQESLPDLSDYYTKTQANNKFVSKSNLTDYSINHIIAGNSEIDNDTVDLRAVYSQDVKSEVSLDPNSIIIRTMSGTDVSTLGISATEVDLTTSMLKYNGNEVATKNDIPEGAPVVIITGNSSTGTFTQDEYDLLFNSNVSFIKFNTTMYYRDWSASTTPSIEFKTIPYVSTTVPNYRLEQKHITVNPDRTWTHSTIRKNYASENIGIINMGANTDTEGTFTSTQLSYLTENTVSLIIKNNLYYYRAGSSYNLYLYRSLPEIAYNADGTTTQTYKLLSVNTTSGEWWNYTRSFTAELTMQEFAVYFEFQKSGTGAGYYSVYFNLKAKRNKYSSSNLSFSQLRDLIIANGNHVECTCQSQASLNMNMISTSENAGDPTILVDSKSADFFEFYSFNDLTNYSITELTY